MQIERRAVCVECKENPPRSKKGKKFKLCEDCRRKDTENRWKVRRSLRQLRNEVTHVIEYNQGEGWRTGYLVKIIDRYADVQPIGSCGRVPDLICVSLADIKLPTCGSPSMPTVADFYKRMEAMKPKKTVVLVAEPYPPMSVLVKEIIDGAVVRRTENAIVSENELAEPEVGDVSFPFGANAVQEKQKPVSAKPKQDKLLVGATYGQWTTIEYTGHSRWRCKSADGEEKIVYAAELRSAI